VVGGVQQHLALGRDVPGGKALQMPANNGTGDVEVLGVDPGVASGGALLGVDHVDHAIVHGGQPGGGVGHHLGHRGVIDGHHDHAGARPATGRRCVCWNGNQRTRWRLFHGGGDLLRLHALCLAEHAVRLARIPMPAAMTPTAMKNGTWIPAARTSRTAA
jgi:hypothetical protein